MNPSEITAVNEVLTTIQETLGDIRERLVKIETTSEYTKKAIEGNGKPGLLKRVDDLESDRDMRKGMSMAKKAILTAVAGLALSFGAWVGKTAIDHVANQTTVEHELQMSNQQTADEIKIVQHDMQSLQVQLKDHDTATRPKKRGK